MALKYTLIADGSSDKTLLKIIKWSLDTLYPHLSNEESFADFRFLQKSPKSLKDKLETAKKIYPFDVVFIHRDAESTNVKVIGQRFAQIKDEIGEIEFQNTVCVIPIKMMEAWLLIDKNAIKKAAGNRNYVGEINLPLLKSLEKENQPKIRLHNLLADASGLKGRNLRKFNPDKAIHLVAEYIEDFSPLRSLISFREFEKDLQRVINKYLITNNVNL